jgi:hypothetical protein
MHSPQMEKLEVGGNATSISKAFKQSRSLNIDSLYVHV